MPQAKGVGVYFKKFVYISLLFICMRNHNILPYTKNARELSKKLRKKMTGCELIFWNATKNSQLGIVMRRQMPILDYVVDFYIKEIGLVIEIDGSSHDNKELEDVIRQGRIEKLGVTFIRFSNEQLKYNLSKVLEKLNKKIKEMKD
jgi:very-short-patch-repair endonuclease